DCAEPGKPFGVLHGYVKNVAVEYPGPFLSDMQRKFVGEHQRSQTEIRELAQQFVVIARQVCYGYPLRYKFEDFPDNYHVRMGPITFTKLPDIDDVAV